MCVWFFFLLHNQIQESRFLLVHDYVLCTAVTFILHSRVHTLSTEKIGHPALFATLTAAHFPLQHSHSSFYLFNSKIVLVTFLLMMQNVMKQEKNGAQLKSSAVPDSCLLNRSPIYCAIWAIKHLAQLSLLAWKKKRRRIVMSVWNMNVKCSCFICCLFFIKHLYNCRGAA